MKEKLLDLVTAKIMLKQTPAVLFQSVLSHIALVCVILAHQALTSRNATKSK